MRKIINIDIEDITLDRDEILQAQGIPPGTEISVQLDDTLKKALYLFYEWAQPIGLFEELSQQAFGRVYYGEGLNERATPVGDIYPKAHALALFAVTIGEKVNKKIDQLFKKDEFVLATMFDATASDGVEKTADIVEHYFSTVLSKSKKITDSVAVLRYSPGYCGWHMSGQKKLFEYLKPEEIGISLLNSYLMKPLKSISGVLVAGPKEIHNFDDTYPFCSTCKTHSCRERIQAIMAAP
jgi:hypothetical protein